MWQKCFKALLSHSWGKGVRLVQTWAWFPAPPQEFPTSCADLNCLGLCSHFIIYLLTLYHKTIKNIHTHKTIKIIHAQYWNPCPDSSTESDLESHASMIVLKGKHFRAQKCTLTFWGEPSSPSPSPFCPCFFHYYQDLQDVFCLPYPAGSYNKCLNKL